MEVKIKSYKDLIVWQKSMELVGIIYNLTGKFPSSELFGITSQMRRASVSIPSNIAEGKRKGTRKQYKQYLLIAYGSGGELETQLEICSLQLFGGKQDLEKAKLLLDEVMKMLNVLIYKLKKPPKAGGRL